MGEDIACEYLVRKGFEVVERNYLKPWGEIDIVAKKGDVLRFVEVKTISREMTTGESKRLSAEDHIHPAKLKRLSRTVETYMAGQKGNADYQIDVIAVELNHSTRTARCTLYEQVL